MKTKYLSLLTLVLVLTSMLAAQTKPIAPSLVVKNLYAAHNAKRGPFFQTKSRARIEQFFAKEFADLIWKDAVDANGGVGVLGFDPLYNAQDTKITRFKIGEPEYGEGNANLADVPVTFRNYKTDETILFRLERAAKGKKWLITNISYPSNGMSLLEMYKEAADPSSTRIEGQLHFEKGVSHILYVGKSTGDYTAYCFANASEVGRAILAACKNGDQCVVTGEVAEGACRPKGLEADLSSSGTIRRVKAVHSLGKHN